MKELFTLYIIEDSYLQTFSHSLDRQDQCDKNLHGQ